ncbi:MAG: GC-type dockerin domain-anchored protein [Phycisphaerales bacterium]
MNIKPAIILTLASLSATGTAQAETVLFAGTDGIIKQLDTITGQISDRGVCSGPVSSMTVHGDTLFLGDQHGIVYTLDLTTGLLNGSFPVNSDANAMAWLGDELVLADSAGEIDFMDSFSGEVNSTIAVTSTDISAIGVDSGGLFVGGLSSLAQRTHIGQEDFEFFAACGSMINSMAFGSDTLYIGGISFGGAAEGTVYLFDKFAGGVNYIGTHEVDSDATALVYTDGLLYIAGSSGIIYEMDPQSGQISRTFDTGIDIQAMTLESGTESCPADYDASGSLNFLDVSTFIELFAEQVIPADTNGDGEFNFFDISEFLRIYTGGC